MAKIYANENFPSEVVACLRQLRQDVLTSHDVGKSNRAVPDEEVLSFASAENRAVLTFNRKDFFFDYIVKINIMPALLPVKKTWILKS
jgi:predicted nuclease of predicted toxin-antitoxin system